MTLSDSRHGRRLKATLRPLPSPVTGLPRLPEPPFRRAVPTTPADRAGARVDCFPAHAAFPKWPEGRHPHCHFRDAMGRTVARCHHRRLKQSRWSIPCQQLNDLSRSLTSLEQDSTIIAVIEMSQSSWLVAGIVPGIERHPLKKLEPSEEELLRLLMRWRAEATKKGRTITRIAVAFEAGRDGFWLARWLRARDIESLRHPPDERGCIARASPGENRSARHGIAQTRLHRLVAWRTRSLPHGGDSDAGGGGCEAPEP